MKAVSKSELAHRKKVSPSAVTAWCKKGMPVLENGRINLKAARKWLNENICPERSGSFAARERKAKRAQRSECLPGAAPSERPGILVDAWRILFDAILSKRHLVAPILAELGVTDLTLLACAADVFHAMCCAFSGPIDDLVYPVDSRDTDYPEVEDNTAAVFGKYGLELTPAIAAAADQMAERAYEVIERAVEAK